MTDPYPLHELSGRFLADMPIENGKPTKEQIEKADALAKAALAGKAAPTMGETKPLFGR